MLLIDGRIFFRCAADDVVGILEELSVEERVLGAEEAGGVGFGDDVVAADAVGFHRAVDIVAEVAHAVAGSVRGAGQGEVEGDAPIGVAFALVGDEVAQGIDRNAGGVPFFQVVFQGLHHVGVRADDDVRALAVEEGGKAFLFGILAGVVFDAPVHAHDDIGGGVEARFGDVAGDVEGVDHGHHLPFAGGDAVGAVGVAEECDFEAPVVEVKRRFPYPACRVGERAGVGDTEGV